MRRVAYLFNLRKNFASSHASDIARRGGGKLANGSMTHLYCRHFAEQLSADDCNKVVDDESMARLSLPATLPLLFSDAYPLRHCRNCREVIITNRPVTATTEK